MQRALIAVFLVATAAYARDINRQRYLLGERASGMGGVAIATPGDPVATYYNPAGLSAVTSEGLSLSASAYQLSTERYFDALDIEHGAVRADMESQVFSTFPSSIVYAVPLDAAKEHWVALSVLVPDYDRVALKLDESGGELAFALKALLIREDITYWIGPSWGGKFGDLRLGVSAFGLVHLSATSKQLGLKFTSGDTDVDENEYYTRIRDLSGLSVTALAEVGLQYDLTPELTVGAVVRSPTLGTLHSSVEVVAFNSHYSEDQDGEPLVTAGDPGYVDRVETDEGTFNYTLPLMFGAGVGYHSGRFAIGLDVTFHAAQDEYELIEGPDVLPEDPSGNPVDDEDRALEIDQLRQTKAIVNANIGVEMGVSETLLARLGFFTDYSVVDHDFWSKDEASRLDGTEFPEVDRYGISAALGILGEKATTSIGFIYAYGAGEVWQFNELFRDKQRSDVISHTITAVLSGSADL